MSGVVQQQLRSRSMPAMGAIALAWREVGFDAVVELFPRLPGFGVSWGSPFCFRCGWLAPTKVAEDYPATWKAEKTIAYAWNAASGWLERAHLHDHAEGGDENPLNLVPLCVLCHEEQPVCRSREEGLEFVRSESPRHRIRFWLQLLTDGYGDQRQPGKAEALRKMLRAQAHVAVVLAEAAEKTLKEMECPSPG